MKSKALKRIQTCLSINGFLNINLISFPSVVYHTCCFSLLFSLYTRVDMTQDLGDLRAKKGPASFWDTFLLYFISALTSGKEPGQLPYTQTDRASTHAQPTATTR